MAKALLFICAVCACADDPMELKFGSEESGFSGDITASIDPGINFAASLNAGIPSPTCDTNLPRCREATFSRTTALKANPKASKWVAEISLKTEFTAKSQQCNLLDMELDISAEMHVTLVSDGKCSDCVPNPLGSTTCDKGETNLVQCVYDTDKTSIKPYCVQFDGTKGLDADDGCNKLVIPVDKKTYNVDFSKALYALTLRLSYLLEDTGAGPLMQALGTDVTWSITPHSIVTAFTGFQFEIDMDITVFDADAIPGVNLVPGIDDIWPAIGLTKSPSGHYVAFEEQLNFLKLIEQNAAGFPANFPPFLKKKEGAITIGEVDALCSADTQLPYGITVAGADPADLSDQSKVGHALSTAIAAKLTAAGSKLSVPDCTQKTDSFGVPSTFTATDNKKTTESLICLVDVASTRFKMNADGSASVSGNINAGAGHNAKALQAALAAAIADGDVKIGAGTVGKAMTGYTKCTAAECQQAGANALAACGPGVCAATPSPGPGPTPPGPGPTPPGPSGGDNSDSHHGLGAGATAGAVVGALAGVGLIGFGAHTYRKRQQRGAGTDPLMGKHESDGSAYTEA